ncbi:hypothetical protein JK628_02840 [Shewanella sp. KX20019]|uniref:hypothetical protein n=1 Tax=Shewanella sp. KX20019 TaxID=2803864 RepID=UPI001928D429|nr:hypothetical protein [Shewanella sp. KX20019]QQX80826.1 hypothetical protein JK628_02840 [Shewanella sp. KX20019]
MENELEQVIKLVNGNAGLLLDSLESLIADSIETASTSDLKLSICANTITDLEQQLQAANDQINILVTQKEKHKQYMVKAELIAKEMIRLQIVNDQHSQQKTILEGKVAKAERQLKESKAFGDPKRLKTSNADLKKRLAERTKERDKYKADSYAEHKDRRNIEAKLVEMGGLSLWQGKEGEKIFLHHSPMKLADKTNNVMINKTLTLVWWHPCGIARLIVPATTGEPMIARADLDICEPSEDALSFAEGYFNKLPNKGRLK